MVVNGKPNRGFGSEGEMSLLREDRWVRIAAKQGAIAERRLETSFTASACVMLHPISLEGRDLRDVRR